MNRWSYFITIWMALAAGPAWGEAYALVAGSNRGGPGQDDLRYAHGDAERVREVLTELGGIPAGNIQLLLDPDRDELLGALDALRERLAVLAGRGEQSVFLFYYSGHARAHALNMGTDEIGLAELRDRLEEMPATVTVAILDACQTGAISHVKGAEPAADFSHNSVSNLNTAGIAVMASSTASELSQESETLGASYFTHHLLTGLRGAADADRDGSVTLSEAYRYAYHRTLVATAATAVGKQHVTLETELRGKGEMVLTRPAEAASAVLLPAELAADVLVHRAPDRTVMAEVLKAAGEPVRLALPPGDFVMFLRSDEEILKCEVDLARAMAHRLAVADCVEAAPEEIGVKGEADERHEHWALEVGVGGMFGVEDDYVLRLDDFGYERNLDMWNDWFTLSVSASHSFSPYLSVHLGWTMLDGGSYGRQVWDAQGEQHQQKFEWSAHGLGIYVRGTLPLFDAVLNPYLQVGGGLTWGATEYRDPLQPSELVDDQIFWGWHLSVGAGLQIMPWRHFGFFGQGNYTYAPTIGNEMGEVHDSGGPGVILGVRGAL